MGFLVGTRSSEHDIQTDTIQTDTDARSGEVKSSPSIAEGFRGPKFKAAILIYGAFDFAGLMAMAKDAVEPLRPISVPTIPRS